MIAETELRGITPAQLLVLWQHSQRHCLVEGWRSTFNGSLITDPKQVRACTDRHTRARRHAWKCAGDAV